METKNFKIDSETSTIEWVGKKVTDAHNGTINIADGALTLTDGELTSGKFTIDTRSIRILDVTDLNTNAQFAGHLASEDFFASEKYPTAVLEITSVSHRVNNKYHIAGQFLQGPGRQSYLQRLHPERAAYCKNSLITVSHHLITHKSP